MTVHEHLLSVGVGEWRACQEARNWAAQYKTAQEVWDNCPHAAWLFWWSTRMGQHKAVATAAKEVANSVACLSNSRSVYSAAAADAAAYAAAAAAYAADAAAYAAAAAAYAAYAAAADAYAADADAYAAAADAYAAAADARQKQNELNMQIARKHLVCPWHETD